MASGEAQLSQCEDESELGGPKFSPPLYQQRYAAVIQLARSMKARKVVDMGCAECKLLRQLKREPYVEELVGVDIDLRLLNIHDRIVHPLTTDYLHRREQPLHFALMHGSIEEPDARLVDFDLLACVEVIEHLDPPLLEAVPNTIFGVLSPKVVVMTTPNAEFNVLFPGFTGFRHPDHRFEWTRSQFQSWCNGVANRYGYAVEFSGVGAPPAGREGVGHCSQMATFTRPSRQLLTYSRRDGATPYSIVSEADHPYVTDPVSNEEKLCREVEYYLNILLEGRRGEIATAEGRDSSNDSSVRIDLEEVLKFRRVSSLSSSVDEIRSALCQFSQSVELDSTSTCAVFPLVDDNIPSSDSEPESSDEVQTGRTSCASCSKPEQEEDWDIDD